MALKNSHFRAVEGMGLISQTPPQKLGDAAKLMKSIPKCCVLNAAEVCRLVCEAG